MCCGVWGGESVSILLMRVSAKRCLSLFNFPSLFRSTFVPSGLHVRDICEK